MLAVKLYETMPSDNENVIKGINPKIPAIVVFKEAPDNTYLSMTDDEYKSYLHSINIEIDEWKNKMDLII